MSSTLPGSVFDIGSSLREARTRQGLDFNEMEFRTKVRAKYLRALEGSSSTSCPAHTYIKGFLRTYADALGMDGQLYVDEYNSRYVAGEEEHPLRSAAGADPDTPPAPAPRVAARRDRPHRHRDAHGARHRRLEVRRPGRAEGAGRERAGDGTTAAVVAQRRSVSATQRRLVHGGAARLRCGHASLQGHPRARTDETIRSQRPCRCTRSHLPGTWSCASPESASRCRRAGDLTISPRS